MFQEIYSKVFKMNEKHILLFVLSVIIYVKHMSKLESMLY